MTAEEIGALAKILTLIGGWPLASVIVMAFLAAHIAPWYALWKITRSQDKAASDQMAELRKITQDGWSAYKDNVDLVRETQVIARSYADLASQLAEIIHLNTQTQTTLVDAIKNNTFCPSVRKAQGKD